MRIGVELRQIVPGACGGIVPLLVGVLAAAFRDYPGHQYHLFCTSANADLFSDLPAHVVRDVLAVEGYFPLLDRQARQRRLDVLFRSYPLAAPLTYPAERQIVLIPDLQHESFPEFFTEPVLRSRRANFEAALAHAGAIATISEHARSTILHHSDTRCSDVFLISPALPECPAASWEQLTDAERSAVPEGEYFLFPGNLWPHKNHRRTLKAFRLFRETWPRPVELILTGHPGGWEALAAEFPGLPVRHLGFVRREFLLVLLQRARALVFFSLFEGFGIPLLEAFAAGTPVLCSNTTSLPEVGGDAVLTCDPTDVRAMSSLMHRILAEDGLREQLSAAGRQRLGLYSWSASARNLIAACERVHSRAAPVPEVSRLIRLRWAVGGVVQKRAPKLARVLRAFTQPRRVLWPALRRRIRPLARVVLAPLRRMRARLVNRLRQWRQRLRQALRSRLGIHHQYPPRPLQVPHPGRVRLPPSVPLISIVTPSYNQAEFLERTIRSVLDQGYPRLEYIVQDGGSTDGTAAILERYRDRLAHCESRRDRGQTHALNLGFRHATGEILAYLNSDDVLLPGALAYVARYFHDHPEVDAIYSHRVIIDDEDREVGRWVLPFHDDTVLSWNDYVPQETLFWRRRVWERIGAALDESFHFAMDWDLLLRLRDAGARFVRVPQFLAAFRVHPQQKTSARIADLGYPEIARLRQRSLGRPVTEQEVQQFVRPFLRQHVILRMLHRLGLTA